MVFIAARRALPHRWREVRTSSGQRVAWSPSAAWVLAPAPESGGFQVEVRDAAGNVLDSRHFDPILEVDGTGADLVVERWWWDGPRADRDRPPIEDEANWQRECWTQRIAHRVLGTRQGPAKVSWHEPRPVELDVVLSCSAVDPRRVQVDARQRTGQGPTASARGALTARIISPGRAPVEVDVQVRQGRGARLLPPVAAGTSIHLIAPDAWSIRAARQAWLGATKVSLGSPSVDLLDAPMGGDLLVEHKEPAGAKAGPPVASLHTRAPGLSREVASWTSSRWSGSWHVLPLPFLDLVTAAHHELGTPPQTTMLHRLVERVWDPWRSHWQPSGEESWCLAFRCLAGDPEAWRMFDELEREQQERLGPILQRIPPPPLARRAVELMVRHHLRGLDVSNIDKAEELLRWADRWLTTDLLPELVAGTSRHQQWTSIAGPATSAATTRDLRAIDAVRQTVDARLEQLICAIREEAAGEVLAARALAEIDDAWVTRAGVLSSLAGSSSPSDGPGLVAALRLLRSTCGSTCSTGEVGPTGSSVLGIRQVQQERHRAHARLGAEASDALEAEKKTLLAQPGVTGCLSAAEIERATSALARLGHGDRLAAAIRKAEERLHRARDARRRLEALGLAPAESAREGDRATATLALATIESEWRADVNARQHAVRRHLRMLEDAGHPTPPLSLPADDASVVQLADTLLAAEALLLVEQGRARDRDRVARDVFHHLGLAGGDYLAFATRREQLERILQDRWADADRLALALRGHPLARPPLPWGDPGRILHAVEQLREAHSALEAELEEKIRSLTDLAHREFPRDLLVSLLSGQAPHLAVPTAQLRELVIGWSKVREALGRYDPPLAGLAWISDMPPWAEPVRRAARALAQQGDISAWCARLRACWETLLAEEPELESRSVLPRSRYQDLSEALILRYERLQHSLRDLPEKIRPPSSDVLGAWAWLLRIWAALGIAPPDIPGRDEPPPPLDPAQRDLLLATLGKHRLLPHSQPKSLP